MFEHCKEIIGRFCFLLNNFQTSIQKLLKLTSGSNVASTLHKTLELSVHTNNFLLFSSSKTLMIQCLHGRR